MFNKNTPTKQDLMKIIKRQIENTFTYNKKNNTIQHNDGMVNNNIGMIERFLDIAEEKARELYLEISLNYASKKEVEFVLNV